MLIGLLAVVAMRSVHSLLIKLAAHSSEYGVTGHLGALPANHNDNNQAEQTRLGKPCLSRREAPKCLTASLSGRRQHHQRPAIDLYTAPHGKQNRPPSIQNGCPLRTEGGKATNSCILRHNLKTERLAHGRTCPPRDLCRVLSSPLTSAHEACGQPDRDCEEKLTRPPITTAPKHTRQQPQHPLQIYRQE